LEDTESYLDEARARSWGCPFGWEWKVSYNVCPNQQHR
jgi:hypothetical protein